MKQFSRQFLSIMLLLSVAAVGTVRADDCNNCNTDCVTDCNTDCNNSCRDCHCATSLFLPRPQGLNSAVLWNPYYYGCDSLPEQCGYFQIGYRFDQTFGGNNRRGSCSGLTSTTDNCNDGNRIAECIFGSSALVFTGSAVADRNTATDILADNFGLSPNFRGTVFLNPRIQNNIIDLQARWELGSWSECLECAYFGVNASVVHSRWRLRDCDPIQTVSGDSANDNFAPGYMNSVVDPDHGTVASSDATEVLDGHTFLFGDNQSPWQFGGFLLRCKNAQNDTKLANIDLILGYDFLRCDTYHFGVFAKASAPTGTRPDARLAFQNIIGNGKHWEVGGGIDAHVQLWSCDEECIAAYLNGNVTHLFKDTQCRSFDFRAATNPVQSGCLSRYLLLKEFDANGNYFRLVPGINFTTRAVRSSFDVQGDAALRFVYYNCGWALGVGYNVYGRSHEKLCLANCCEPTVGRNFGIKGTSNVTTEAQETQSQARIFNGAAADATSPTYVTAADLDLRGVPSQLTHKIFGHIDYQWADCECAPYLGVYGGVEFGQGTNGRNNNDGSNNRRGNHCCTANKWEVSVRGGVNF